MALFLGDDVFAHPHGAHGNRFGGDLQLFFRAGHHERVGLLGWGEGLVGGVVVGSSKGP